MSDQNNDGFGPENRREVSSAQVMRAAAWLSLAKIASYAAAFLSTIILARILVPSDFGVIAISMAIVGIAAGLLDLPVTSALIALDSPTEDEFNTAWTISILRSILVSVIILAAAHPLAMVFNMPEITPVVMALTGQTMIFGLRNPYFENFARSLNFSWDVLAEVSAKVVQVIVSISAALIWKSYWAFVAGMLAGALVSMMVTYIAARRMPKLSLRSPRRLFGYSVWLGLSMIVNRLNQDAAYLISGRLFGQAILGQLHVGNKLSSEISHLILTPIIRSLFSAFSRLADDMHRFRAAYLKAQSATMALSLPLGAGLALVADPLIPLMLGPNWKEAVTIVQFYAPCTGLLLAAGPIRSVAMSLSRTKLMLGRDILNFVIRVSCLITGTLLFGFIGLLGSYAVSTLIATVINLIFLKRLIQISILDQVSSFGRSILSTLLMVGVVLAVRQMINFPDSVPGNILTVGVLAACGMLTYASAHILLWTVHGRPDGIEQTALSFARKRLRARGFLR